VRRRATTILGAAAAPLLVLSNVLLPGLPAKAVDVVAQAPPVVDRMLTAHLVYTVASLLFIPFTLTLWRVPGRRGSTLRLVGCLADDPDGVERPNAGIDRQLFLAEKTVRNNVTALLAKTGAATRPALIALARDAGQEPAPPP